MTLLGVTGARAARRTMLLGLTALAIAASAAGCGDDSGGDDDAKAGTAAATGKGPYTVVITDKGYEPRDLQVPVGARVKFVNRSKTSPHTAKDIRRGDVEFSPQPGPTKHDGSEVNRANRIGFATHALFPAEAQTVVFPVAQSYSYLCAFHGDTMTGTIEVR